jgi:5-deoxy-D-glucuronate isomerase
MSGFWARLLALGESREYHHPGEKTACVLLSGIGTLEWERERREIGKRRTVFDGLPYALYLAPGDGCPLYGHKVFWNPIIPEWSSENYSMLGGKSKGSVHT